MANSPSSKSAARSAKRTGISQPNKLRMDLRALWLVRSRVIRGNLAFLLVIIGYDSDSRSINNRIYLVYALAFFALWIFMVLILLADFGANFLAALPLADAAAAASLFGSLGLAGLFIFDLHQAARRSPFSLSEVDAQIVSMTPIDRRLVAVQWMFESWLARGVLVGPAAIVLGYALLQAQSPLPLTTGDLPAYLMAGLRMFIIAAPLYLGTLSLAWSVGAWRLQGQVSQRNLRLLAPLSVGLLAGLIWLTGWQGALTWLIPLAIPLRSGLGLMPFWIGMQMAVTLAGLGLLALWRAANGMSLSRAAQETQDREAIQAAAWLGQSDLAEELASKERLGTGRKPTRLPGKPGLPALIWKNLLQSRRRFRLATLIGWLPIFGLLLVLLFFPGWTTRIWSLAISTLMVMRLMTAPLRKELSRWWIFRQLPFHSNYVVLTVLILPMLGMLLIGAAALVTGWALGTSPWPAVIWVYLTVIPALGLAGAFDILRQCKTGRLLSGSVPDLSIVGLLLGGLVLTINAGAAWLSVIIWGLPLAAALPFILPVGIALNYILWKAAGRQLRHVQ
jgi:hypothetical protein